MNTLLTTNYLIWGVFPYVALTLFFVVPFLRMIYRPFGLTTRPSGIFEGRGILGMASHMLHWGIFLVFFGHLVGLIGGILGWGSWVAAFFWMGTIGGVVAMLGSAIALVRRSLVPEVRAMSQPDDYIVHLFLLLILGVAVYQAVVQQIWGASYTAAPWFASLWRLQPQPELMASAPLLTQIHVLAAFAFAAYFPFTKLIHAWTLPVNYFVRPYQVMRTAARKFQNRWEYRLVSDKSYMTYLTVAVIGLMVVIGVGLSGPTGQGVVQEARAALGQDDPSGDGADATNGRIFAQTGYALYVSQCARCHGLEGDGEGPGARSPTFATHPRDLTAGAYRFVSTEEGVASDRDLRRTIVEGLHGSGMIGFPALSNEQVDSLVRVLDQLWVDRPHQATPIQVPARPASSRESIAEGRTLFAANCSTCHGTSGAGDGPLAPHVRDDAGRHIPPTNLAAGRLKAGEGPAQLYQRIAVGIPGGSGQWLMPQFSHLDPEQIWAIVAYLEQEVLPQRRLADRGATR
ncbi:respiratory nitrate reductase subunit gamma [Thioalkalicoccus limnaeus]|uniref:Respiratory nitrate reductase subunit gamma n=1 Tax=Thioalkalicoccus limnaeus TaxID=120681 RepID=A0ABV4BGU2_9GAMM